MSIVLWQLPISDDHLKSIGLVATSWGLLETAINFSIWTVLGVTELQGRAITSNMSASQRINSLESIASARLGDASHLNELKTIVRRIRDAQAKRNRLVHAEWGTSDNYWNPPDPRTATASDSRVKRGMLVLGKETYTADAIQEIGYEISNVCSELKVFIFNRFIVEARHEQI
jgi:hypothetical protein